MALYHVTAAIHTCTLYLCTLCLQFMVVVTMPFWHSEMLIIRLRCITWCVCIMYCTWPHVVISILLLCIHVLSRLWQFECMLLFACLAVHNLYRRLLYISGNVRMCQCICYIYVHPCVWYVALLHSTC